MKRLLITAVLLTAVSQVTAKAQISCPTGSVLVVQNGHTTCSNSVLLPTQAPSTNGGGIQSPASAKAAAIRQGCLRRGLNYVSNPVGGYCVRSGLAG